MDLYRAWFLIKKGKKSETEQNLRKMITHAGRVFKFRQDPLV